MIPAVYRNGRYEYRLQTAEAQILQLAVEIERALGLIARMAQSMTPENQIPALPETPRAFGRGH